jgi:hypothetical protein
MVILHIEYPVPDYTIWKKLFDDRTISRENSGMRSYKILRPIDGANFVIVDIEFETPAQAQSFLIILRTAWQNLENRVMKDPTARIFEVVELDAGSSA